MKQWFWALLCAVMLCLALPAMAEDTYTVSDPATAGSIRTECEYLNIFCPAENGEQVTLSVYDENGACIYQRDYGASGNAFFTDDLYLPLNGAETVYSVTMNVGDNAYSFTVTRVSGYLTDNAASTGGYPLSLLSGVNSWRMATIVDVTSLEGSSVTVPLYASNAYEIGTATLSVSGGKLTVSAQMSSGVNGTIDSATVYVATTAVQARELGGRNFTGMTGSLDRGIDLYGASYAAVYVRMSVSFDPGSVSEATPATLPGQESLWQQMLNETANEAVG